MDYLKISRVITLIASLFITIGLYDQVLKIFKTKSANDFTWTIILALAFNELAWINYGYSLSEWPIIIVGLANSPAILLLIIGLKKYKNA